MYYYGANLYINEQKNKHSNKKIKLQMTLCWSSF